MLAGCHIRDAELVQFHPSGLIAPENAAGTLASKALRGEGGILPVIGWQRLPAGAGPATSRPGRRALQNFSLELSHAGGLSCLNWRPAAIKCPGGQEGSS
ncbi:hypothetical protein Psi02_67040 [Planotetraspora silvatica]|uniref:FAD-dependent oxidoreductase 2 FAD-binding domain-containing protein n=1 Tax=Planotetraspora silvatica TaxID=234614 RepID=A0A8J3V5B0_9ACTN|nr:hypothetical protein Psi02_67040 [Planotetraspora silvatica]